MRSVIAVALLSVQMTLVCCGLPGSVDAADPPPLWAGDRPAPKSAELADIEAAEFHVIKPREPEKDGYNWLHGVALAWHNGRLYVSYGHNRGAENTAGEEARGQVSDDGGRTWSDVFTIDVGNEPELAVSHGVFLSHGGRLWAFQGAFYGGMKRVHTRAYRLNEADGTWEKLGVVVGEGFWPMQEPLRMADGNWIMAGLQVGKGDGGSDDPAAVAISHGEDLTKWDLVTIPKPDDLEMWGESTVIVDGANVLNISRYRRPEALVSLSEDFGRSWSEMRTSNLPMAASKPYAGTLSTGQHYLVATTTADSGNRRSPLTIAVSKPGELSFRRIYRIRDAVHEGPGESGKGFRLSYPYAVEHDGKLYVGYSNDGGRGGNRNSAELAVIPVSSLTVE